MRPVVLEARIVHIQISAKLDNPPLSYSDLVFSNLAVASLGGVVGADRPRWHHPTGWYPNEIGVFAGEFTKNTGQTTLEGGEGGSGDETIAKRSSLSEDDE